MSAKKYLSLEEAAQVLGMRSDEVIRMRERGDLRGFADRGTWKFKSDDVEEAKRRRQPDSNPDVPLMDDDSVLADDDDLGAQPTMVRRGAGSDSDVRLILDDNLGVKPLAGSSAEIPILKGPGSDSDVRLVGNPSSAPLMGSDSDVKLLKPKSDSGIRLSDSDSDVRLASPGKGSDSDVKLVSSPAGSRTDSDIDSFDLDAGESVLLEHDSGIHLPEGSSVKLTGGSSLRLTADSGIRLKSPADSGILLEGPDSGIKLQSGLGLAGLSGPKLAGGGKKPADDLDMTAPMLLGPRDDMSGTDPEVPMFATEDDDEDLMPKKRGAGDTHAETSVIMFDDDDEDLDQVAATMVKKKSPGLSGMNFDDSSSEVETVEEAIDDEELEVSDDILGEDDELEEMEVFDTEDSDFGDSFEEGQSSADFAPRGLGKIAVAEREWGGLDVALIAFSTLALTVGVMVGVDLLHAVWGAGAPIDEGPFMAMMGGLFK